MFISFIQKDPPEGLDIKPCIHQAFNDTEVDKLMGYAPRTEVGCMNPNVEWNRQVVSVDICNSCPFRETHAVQTPTME